MAKKSTLTVVPQESPQTFEDWVMSSDGLSLVAVARLTASERQSILSRYSNYLDSWWHLVQQ